MDNKIQAYTTGEIENALKPYQDKILQLIDKPTFIREVAFASQILSTNDKLRQCSQTTILQSIYNVATTGLSLNPILKYAALTPRYVKGEWKCILSPQYQGLVKLITDSGSVRSVYAHAVYEGDIFEPTLGTDAGIKHIPKYESKEWNKVYAVAVLHDGSKMFEVMTKEEVFEVRATSDTWKAYEAKKIEAKQVMWITWEVEMARKTVIKRLVKYLPKTEQYDKVAEAIQLDNSEYGATDGQINFIESLILTSTYDGDTQTILIDKALSGITSSEASSMIRDLQENQMTPEERGNMSMTEINRAVENRMAREK